ncbi:MAG TPA: hypothetical protein DCP02_06655 [Actinobacteria bacterium]|nr:hypothetical protein [Actinomycetota bacterium]
MYKFAEEYVNKNIIKVLRKINIKKGQKILDCCCGAGNYTLPVAIIVGENGLVYALDRNKEKLSSLKKKSYMEKFKNIKIIEKEFESRIPLSANSIDVVLLYDIFWYFPLEDKRLIKLLDEVYRILKDKAMISVYPEHIDMEKLKERIENAGFWLEDIFYETIIHENNFKKGRILNFRKTG